RSASGIPVGATTPWWSGVRRISVVEHEIIAVRVGEEGHVADAGVEGVAGELDALGLELGAGRGDVIDVERRMGVLLRRELEAEGGRFPDAEAGVARPELEAHVRGGSHADRR